MIFPTSQPDAWQKKAFEFIEQRNLSRSNFTRGAADSTSYWWSYSTPSGHHLAAGSRRLGSGLPIDWQQWRWDSPEPPSAAPWDDERWIPYDGNISTSNWTIEPFPFD
ncbi:hypothetical protein BSP99_07490 [Corynebacterium glutamicum]|uniref:Uncharacterized protein n=2 Tax=Corynebacterium glutamicum TaxID=1718 RepID=Q8NQS8_CORGL|nr:hypothetical protein BSP99_07490 [Corynebacterium glutamicum]AST20587.1 hypothetical protein CEY17_07255 [Corynebacterium glutamicum ATCC 14067]CAF21356.1 hypothetical protein predicted by Glimmer/Critica [Corynebacterium glutamicum ATCC 13032]BAF54402.1 hypothetical protein cgR_5027 [Corynebacterium glutamicum R]ARV64509.1 hypothetical protein B7P23_06185 [Corynebacterium glutamicum]